MTTKIKGHYTNYPKKFPVFSKSNGSLFHFIQKSPSNPIFPSIRFPPPSHSIVRPFLPIWKILFFLFNGEHLSDRHGHRGDRSPLYDHYGYLFLRSPARNPRSDFLSLVFHFLLFLRLLMFFFILKWDWDFNFVSLFVS